MGDDLFKAFSSGSDGLSGSRLFQYMGAAKKPASAASPFEAAAVNAPVFVPASTSAADLARLSLNGPAPTGFGGRADAGPPQAFAFNATSVNTNGHHPGAAFQQESDPLAAASASNGQMYYFDGSAEYPQDPSQQYPSGSGELGAAGPTYGGPPAHLAHYRPRGAAQASFFASDEIKMTLMGRQHQRLGELNPDQASLELPPEVEGYANLVPLEPATKVPLERPGFFMTHPSTVYKAVSTKDGLVYALRRIHNCRLLNTKCLGLVDLWKKLQHANVVGLRNVFTTKAFNDYSLVFVYDYHGGAETLKSRHFAGLGSAATLVPGGPETSPPSRPPPTHGGGGPPGSVARKGMEEAAVWMYVIQLSSALRTIHAAGLAATTVDPSKILITGRSKLLINCCGIMDVLTFEQAQMDMNRAILHFQQDELISLGRLIVALCCGSLAAASRENISTSMGFIQHSYSNDMANTVSFLLRAPAQGRPKNINDIMPMIGARFYAQLEAAQTRMDLLENELAKEIDNGRLFRLLAKLGTLNERPEFAMDAAWAETGDRYLLKLYRDHLFHQVTPDGRPWLDLAHVVQSLNKLDAGVSEKVALASRDEQNLLLVSYADLRRCLEGAFKELSDASAVAAPSANGLPELH